MLALQNKTKTNTLKEHIAVRAGVVIEPVRVILEKSQERQVSEIRFSKAGRWSVLKALDSECMLLSNRMAKYG